MILEKGRGLELQESLQGSYKILVRKPEEKRSLGRPELR
jgi:hypothetical protein